MSLTEWSQAGWLRPHKASPQEIRELWLIAQRDLADSSAEGISQDWQFGIAYNAALKLCTILLHAEGYRPGKGQSGHHHTLQALPHILGNTRQKDADYLDSCREKRNTVEYDHVGRVSRNEVNAIMEFTRCLGTDVLRWLREKHPELVKLI